MIAASDGVSLFAASASPDRYFPARAVIPTSS